MKYVIVFCISLTALTVESIAGGGSSSYGTIVNQDGSMVAIYRHSRSANISFAANFDKNGNFSGGCVKEDMAAYQLRKARMKAASKWRRGYVPRKFPCRF